MAIIFNNYFLQKNGNSPEEYEDAFAPKSEGVFDNNNFTLAISDGATESSFSCEWAKILARSFVKDPTYSSTDFKNKIDENGIRWYQIIQKRKLSWHAEEKIKNGTYATFLGATINFNNGLTELNAISIGDSCLFHFRNDKLLNPFPISSSIDFNNSPFLVSSNSKNNLRAFEHLQILRNIVLNKGDYILFASDALSNWILSCCENDLDDHKYLFQMESKQIIPDSYFEAFIQNLRDQKKIKNDDVTLLIIKVI